LTVHDRKATSDIAEVARNVSRLDASLLSASVVQVTSNFEILAAPDDPIQSMQVKPEHLDAILNLAVNQYDFIILDVSNTLDELTIKALDRAQSVFLVVQTMLPYIRNASRLLTVFRSLGYPPDKVEIIVNRLWRNGEIGLDDLRATLGPNKTRVIPNGYKEVARAINQGVPLAMISKSSPVLKAITDLMQSLLPKPDQVQMGMLGRLLRLS
jgi:pilus assembly protein CpaE